MNIAEISENVIKEFEMGMEIPYLYGIRFWLPQNNNSEEIAKYVCENSPYTAHARENGINASGEELPTLSISIDKEFKLEEIVCNFSVQKMSEILVSAYEIAEEELPHLRSVRFWLPLRNLVSSSSEQSKQIAEYINQNYSDYQAHKKKNIKIPQIDQLPSLVIGASDIIK